MARKKKSKYKVGDVVLVTEGSYVLPLTTANDGELRNVILKDATSTPPFKQGTLQGDYLISYLDAHKATVLFNMSTIALTL